jgi:hypothetical protein
MKIIKKNILDNGFKINRPTDKDDPWYYKCGYNIQCVSISVFMSSNYED